MSFEMVTALVAQPSSAAAESRKIRKPLMEKRRRARINQSLNELKRLLIDANSIKKEGSRPSKLEKADILEMTVRHLHRLHQNYVNTNPVVNETEKDVDVCVKFREGFSKCAKEVQEMLSKCKEVDSHLKDRLTSHLSHCLDNLTNDALVSSSQDIVDSTVNQPTVKEDDQCRERLAESKCEVSETSRLKTQVVIQTPNGYTLLPTKLPNGDLAFVIPADLKRVHEESLPLSTSESSASRDKCSNPTKQNHPAIAMKECPQPMESVWRPW